MVYSKRKSNSKPTTLIKKPANTSVVKSISISYPPLKSTKGSPFLSQNRQFQWTNTGNVIYPVIPSSAATLLQSKGLKVFWDDAIAQKLSFNQWFNRLKKNKPDLIAIETKTPVIKKHWKIINQIKRISSTSWQPIIVLMGDHVTALPKESLINSFVDYILVGGDYDFLLNQLINQINSNKAPKNKIIKLQKQDSLESLPIIDRQLTQWQLYAYNNSNYKYKPGSYIMSGRDCWWGKCTFCSWAALFPREHFRCFSVKHTISEIENLVNNFGVKEIFDDSGTLPVGKWLNDLCHQIIKRGLNKKVTFGCNMRFGALSQKEYNLMKKANFRFILYGLESANQITLDFVNKNEKTTDAIKTLKMAKIAGLEPHVTVMIGFPHETLKDAQKTLNLGRKIFQNNLADSLQATILIPYPGTPLFTYCQKNKLLLTENWDKYDMRQPIIKSVISPQKELQLVQNLFKGILTPKFILKKILSIRSFPDILHLSNYTFKYIQKLKDFS
jgi:anaerobic magnesium-protoporphyrin IX monomethyl ester cyclase